MPRRLILFTLLMGILGYCYGGSYGKDLMDSISNISFFPQVKETFSEWSSYFFPERPASPEYGNLQMLDSLDYKLWPHQRRHVRHQIVDKMEERVNAFPSQQSKFDQIRSLDERLKILEAKCYGTRRNK